jgi:hypothetical protein
LGFFLLLWSSPRNTKVIGMGMDFILRMLAPSYLIPAIQIKVIPKAS